MESRLVRTLRQRRRVSLSGRRLDGRGRDHLVEIISFVQLSPSCFSSFAPPFKYTMEYLVFVNQIVQDVRTFSSLLIFACLRKGSGASSRPRTRPPLPSTTPHHLTTLIPDLRTLQSSQRSAVHPSPSLSRQSTRSLNSPSLAPSVPVRSPLLDDPLPSTPFNRDGTLAPFV